MMKKVFINVAFFLLLLVGLKGEEKEFCITLEKIWDYACKNNLNIVEKDINIKKSKENLDYANFRFIPSVSAGFSSAFNSDFGFENGKNFNGPEEVKAYIEICENFSETGNISILPNISYSKDFFADDSRLTFDKLNLEIGLKQKIYPNIRAIFKKNELLFDVEEAECLRKCELIEILKEITSYFIDFRRLIRKKEIYCEYQKSLLMKRDNFKKLSADGKLEFYEIYKLNDEIKSYTDIILECELEIENLKIEIINQLGIDDLDLKMCEDIDFLSELPDIKSIFTENPLIEYYEILIEKKNLEYHKLNRIYSPEFEIKTSLPMGTINKSTDYLFSGGSKNWSLSLAMNFSPEYLLKKKNKIESEDYKKFYGKKIDFINSQMNQRKEIYSDQAEKFEKQLQEYENRYIEKEKIYKDYINLFHLEKCTYMELIESHLDCIYIKSEIENIKDNIWYSKWESVNSYL